MPSSTAKLSEKFKNTPSSHRGSVAAAFQVLINGSVSGKAAALARVVATMLMRYSQGDVAHMAQQGLNRLFSENPTSKMSKANTFSSAASTTKRR